MTYLAAHPDLGIVYHRPSQQTLRLEAYCDANWGGDNSVKAKSTSGSAIYFAGGLIDWGAKLQTTVAQSSAGKIMLTIVGCNLTNYNGVKTKEKRPRSAAEIIKNG